jgi:hypothetical protein
MMARPTTKKKPMTLEDFAAAVHHDYLAISKNMATKADLKRFATKDDLFALNQKMVTREEFRDLRSDVKMITDAMLSKADLAETIRRELDSSPYVKETDVKDLRERLLRIEEKLGLKPMHRAA